MSLLCCFWRSVLKKVCLSVYMHHHWQESQSSCCWFLYFNQRIIHFCFVILNVDHIFFLNMGIANIQCNIINAKLFLGKLFSHGSEEVFKRQRILQSPTVKICFNAASDLKAFCLTCTECVCVIHLYTEDWIKRC